MEKCELKLNKETSHTTFHINSIDLEDETWIQISRWQINMKWAP
jgi:hypothetical protein